MIKIQEQDSAQVITANVTDFSDALGYCEHKIPFYIEGIQAPPSQATIQGSRSHAEEEKYEEEHAELVPVTAQQMEDANQDIEFQREKIHTRLVVPFKFAENQVLVALFGRADKVYRQNQALVVEDDKFTANPRRYDSQQEPYLDQKLQILAYLNSLYSDSSRSDPKDWFDIPHENKMWKLQIKQHGIKEPYKIFQGIQSKDDLSLLHYSLDRFAKIVLEMEERKHHDIPGKCKPCRYANQCGFKL